MQSDDLCTERSRTIDEEVRFERLSVGVQGLVIC